MKQHCQAQARICQMMLCIFARTLPLVLVPPTEARVGRRVGRVQVSTRSSTSLASPRPDLALAHRRAMLGSHPLCLVLANTANLARAVEVQLTR